jgi:hypothetical protein
MPLSEFVPDVVKHIDNGGVGCCLHSSVYLCKLLHDKGIYSEVMITLEPTELPDGTKRTDYRVSVLYCDKDTGKYYVANPVEDAEAFTRDGLSSEERLKHYIGETGELDLEKDNIHTKDASRVELADFISRYGDGTGYQLGSLFGEDKEVISLSDLMKTATTIDLKDLSKLNERFGVSGLHSM